ncbi:YhcH/YjgK/YiaL family protein [Cerasicoccus maritimus]|uniref:YhcH/YjgK/YiaL family protein n=1 Tax=Cerasicoccus maritimus TaxID=490089 RepID=UPI002852B170|nr:YhcH/YjgK/YiaL family protein [Cerasicoccus maritimus]
MIVDHISNWQTYTLGEAWEKAFAFLTSIGPYTADGEYPIDGDDLFARVMTYDTKAADAPDAILESHEKFADIQMSLVEAERIAVYPTHTLKSKTGYLAEKDAEFYHYETPAQLQLTMRPGTFALLLPQDAHMPALNPGSEIVSVKKVVVKVGLSRLKL